MTDIDRQHLIDVLARLEVEVADGDRSFFTVLADPGHVAAAVIEAISEQAPTLVGRVTEILSAAGYTDARSVFPGGFLVTEGPGYVTTGWVIVSVPWTDAKDGERHRLLARFAETLREGGLEVAPRGRYLQVRARAGEGADNDR